MTEADRQIFKHNCTASALSFVFENLSKPVIVTGSQIPLSQSTVSRSSCTKQHADGFGAFVSPSYPVLLEAGIEIKNIAGITQKVVNTRLRVSDIQTHSMPFASFPRARLAGPG